MKILFENEKAIIQINEQINSIELIWKKNQDSETYKMIFIKILEYIKVYKSSGFLSDIRNEGIVGPASSKWVQTEIMPKAFSYGLKKIAVVMNPDVFKEFYVKNIEKAAGNNSLKYFDTIELASNWLAEK